MAGGGFGWLATGWFGLELDGCWAFAFGCDGFERQGNGGNGVCSRGVGGRAAPLAEDGIEVVVVVFGRGCRMAALASGWVVCSGDEWGK